MHGNESHRYLGRLLCLSPSDRIRIELQNRKNHAWASFHKHKKVILNSHKRMRGRVENARTLYNWTSWSHRCARDQWRFAVHLTATISPMMSAMLRYTSTERHDSEGLYIPRRFVGRPKMKWDYYLQSFFQHFFS